MAAVLSALALPKSFPSSLSSLPFFLPLSVWFRNCSVSHLGFGILPNPATSQAPQTSLLLSVGHVPCCPDSSPAPALSWHQHLRNYWQKALELLGNAYTVQYLPLKEVEPPRTAERSVSNVYLAEGSVQRAFSLC